MTMRTSVVALVMALSAAAVGAAQVQPPQARINTALDRARQVGIPVELLESKIAEGKAKGVSLERIAEAVERREAALEKASEAMQGQRNGQGVAPSELSAGADAVESGVSDAVLKVIAETAPRDRRAVALAALAQLVENGHTPESALERVQEALARGPAALANLPAQARAEGRRGGPPDASGRGRGAGAPAGPPQSVPAPGGASQPSRPGGRPESPGPGAGATPPTSGGRPTGAGGGRGGA